MSYDDNLPLATASRDAMLEEMGEAQDLPALGQSINNVISLSTSETKAVQEVTSFVLSDPALTQKILRLANSAHYRNHTGVAVTTVSRAIFLLGLDTIRASALAMTLAEKIGNSEQSQAVRAELVKSFYASAIARELCRTGPGQGCSEEAVIAALFANLGQLMTAAYAYDKYLMITQYSQENDITFDKAAVKVLGCSFAFITEKMLQNWSFPESIINATQPLFVVPVKPPKQSHEIARLIANFSAKVTPKIGPVTAASVQSILPMIQQYGGGLELSTQRLSQVLETVAPQVDSLIRAIGLNPAKSANSVDEVSIDADELPDELLLAGFTNDTCESGVHPSGKPLRAKDMLMAGVSEMTLLGGGSQASVNDSVLHVLETLYRSLGVRVAVFFFKDSKANQFKPRMALGENQKRWQNQLSAPGTLGTDVFSLSLKKGVEIVINDTAAPKIAALLPAWHKMYFYDSKSFLILPVVVNKAAVGFFYLDRTEVAPEGITEEEAALIKILRNQVVAALTKR